MGRRVLAAIGRVILVTGGALIALVATELVLRLIGLGGPILYDNRLTYGYRPVPGQSRQRLFGARIHVNSLGVRGPEPAPDALRLLFLGDSVTWGGSQVDDRDLFAAIAAERVAARLPARFPSVAPLDAGVNAWGPQNVLALLEERGSFGSRVWVLTLLQDDFRREKVRDSEVPYFNVPPRLALEELIVLAGYKAVTAYKVPKPAADLEQIAAENVAACTRILAAAAAAGARVLVAWHPSAAAFWGSEVEPMKARILAVTASAGVAMLDLTPAYLAAGEGVYSDGLHLSRTGHRVAGAAIGERLVALLAAE